MALESEYKNPTRLVGESSVYFRIPASVILDKESGDARTSAFSFFSIRRGLDNAVTFTLNGMARWLCRKPDRHKGGVNDRLARETSRLADGGYISLSDEPGNSSEVDAAFDVDRVSRECDDGYFAVVYLDELRRILEWKGSGECSVKNADSVLLVFSYIRMKVPRRRNRMFAEEAGTDIETRKAENPEAYDCFCYEIAEDVGLSPRTVSKAVDVLNELGLVYSEQLPRTSEGGKWRTNRTIFCNRYKRENGNLLACGKGYYMAEAENKKRKLKSI